MMELPFDARTMLPPDADSSSFSSSQLALPVRPIDDLPSSAAGDIELLFSAHSPTLFQDETAHALRADGFVVIERPISAGQTHSRTSTPNLLLSLSGSLHQDAVQNPYASQRSGHFDCPWISATLVEGRLLLIRPALEVGCQPCYECVQACTNARLRTIGLDEKEFIFPEPAKALLASAIISIAVSDALNPRRGRSTLNQNSVAILYDLYTMTSGTILIARMPGCASCWSLQKEHHSNTSSRFSLPALFETCSRTKSNGDDEYAAMLPKSVTRRSNASHPRSYPHSVHVPLSVWPTLYGKRFDMQTGSLQLQELSTILFLTFGRWNKADAKRPDRVLPSAGNLGSPSAFLIIQEVEGLDPGTYFYNEMTHSLVRIDSFCIDIVAEPLSGFPEDSSGAPPNALLVMIGSYSRISVKYGAFGYRLIHFDSGLHLAHIQSIARAMQVSTSHLHSWPDEMLSTHLGLNSDDSPITGAIALFANQSHSTLDGMPAACEFSIKEHALLYTDVSFPSATMLAQHIHTLSRQELPRRWSESCIGALSCKKESLKGSPLSELSLPEHWDDLLVRKSSRAFAPKDIARSILAFILEQTQSNGHSYDGASRVTVVATICDFSAAQPTWTTFGLSKERLLVPYQTVAGASLLDSLFVDPAYAKAPLIFWICGEVKPDPWQYRCTLLEAGRMSYELTQKSQSFALHGAIVAGIWPERVMTTLGLTRCEEMPLLAFACGL